MSWLSKLFNLGRTKHVDQSEQASSSPKTTSWSFFSLFKKNEADYTKLSTIKNELQEINRTTFWRQSSLSARIKDVWAKKQVPENSKLDNQELMELFSISKGLKEKEDEFVNSWNSGFLGKFSPAQPTSDIKEMQRWALQHVSVSHLNTKSFAQNLLTYLDIEDDGLKTSMECLEAGYITNLANLIFSEQDRNPSVQINKEFIKEEIETINNGVQGDEKLDELESQLSSNLKPVENQTLQPSVAHLSAPSKEKAPILPICVIPNKDGFDCNRCFLNAPFQLLMRLPELRSCLKDLLQNHFGVIETYALGQQYNSENLQYAYQGLLQAITDYEAGEKGINLTPLRALFVGEENRIGEFGEAEAVLSKIFAPFMQIPSLTSTLPQLVKKTYLGTTQENGLDLRYDANHAICRIEKEGDRKFYSESESSLIFQCQRDGSVESFFQLVEYVDGDQSAMGGQFWDQSKGIVSCIAVSGQTALGNNPNQLIFNIPKSEVRPLIPFEIEVPRVDGTPLKYQLVGAVLHLVNHYVSIIKDGEGKYQYVNDKNPNLQEANEQDFFCMQKNATLVAYELVES